MSVAARFIIVKVVIVMNPITIGHDVMARNETPEKMIDLRRRSTYTIENLRVCTHTVLTTLSRAHLG